MDDVTIAFCYALAISAALVPVGWVVYKAMQKSASAEDYTRPAWRRRKQERKRG